MSGKKAVELAKEGTAVGRLAAMIVWVAPHPEEVVFYVMEGRSKVYVEIDIPPGERGKVIGREGSMIQAIRTVFYASLSKEDPRYELSLVEDKK